MVTHQLQLERRTTKTRRSKTKTDILPLDHATGLRASLFCCSATPLHEVAESAGNCLQRIVHDAAKCSSCSFQQWWTGQSRGMSDVMATSCCRRTIFIRLMSLCCSHLRRCRQLVSHYASRRRRPTLRNSPQMCDKLTTTCACARIRSSTDS